MIYLNVELRGISLRWTISKLKKIKTSFEFNAVGRPIKKNVKQ